MAVFLIDLLNFCLIPFQRTDNLLVFVPTACITVSFLFLILYRLLRSV